MSLLAPHVIVPNSQASPTNGSMAGNITSQALICQTLSMASFEFDWVGTSPVGTVSIQGSNTYSLNADGSVQNAGTWNTLVVNYGGAAVTTVPVSGNSGSGLIDVVATGIYALRVIYTFTSGTGTLTVTAIAKQP